MASGSKTTAVHFTLIFFVMLSVILGVVSYMYYDDDKGLRAELSQVKVDLDISKSAFIKVQKDLDGVKKAAGYLQPKVGNENNPEDGTVLKAIADTVKNNSDGSGTTTLEKLVVKLRQQIDTLTKERDVFSAQLASEKIRTASLHTQYNVKVQRQTTVAQRAEEDLAGVQLSNDEDIRNKQKEIDNANAESAVLRFKIQQIEDDHEKVELQLKDRIIRLKSTNTRLQDIIDVTRKNTPDPADGLIRYVDNVNKLVWINLGEVDNLPKRLTLSVYSKNSGGVGQGTHDIKASIEVTRILGPHLAECKIREDDIRRPITKGDLVYTPAWSPGVKERFSFVGLIDLDGDKKYELDRKQLHHIITAANAEIGGEVDNQGVFKGKNIDVNTKYLVVGHIPSPTDFAELEKKNQAKEIQKNLKKMREQARERGVRVISLKDFLAYMGHVPSRRLWLPGEDIPWQLKSGSHSTSVNETIGDRVSSGTNSGIYSKSKRLKQPKSSGQTSKLFK